MLADQTSATLRITIVAPRSMTATIDTSTDGAPPRHWSAQVGGARVSTLRGLPPAVYRVAVTLSSGGAATIDVPLTASEIVSLEARLAPAAGGLQLTVVDRRHVSQGTDFRADQLRDLPASGSVWSLLETASPFVILDRMDTGGATLGTSGRIGNRGASWTSTSMSMGRIDVARVPGTGDLALIPELETLEAVSVASGLAPPDTAAAGGAIGLVPRRPTASRQGALDLSMTTPGMVSVNAPPAVPSIARMVSSQHLALQWGGPVSSRVGAFVSGGLSRSERHERDRLVHPTSDVDSVFAHVVANPTDRDQVQVLAIGQRAGHDYGGRMQFQDPNVTERDAFLHSQMTWSRQTNGNRAELALGYQRGTFTPTIGSAAGGTVDRVTDGPVPSPPARTTVNRADVQLRFEPREWQGPGAAHGLEFGLAFGRSQSTSHLLALPPVAELVGGLPARIWVPGGAPVDSRRHILHVAGFVNDRIAPAQHLTIDVGFHTGVSRGSAEGAADAVTWPALLPRVSFLWAPWGIAISGGYGRYESALPFDVLAFGDPGEPLTNVYRWNDVNMNGRFDPGELGVLVARAGRNQAIASIDPALRPPRTDEFTLGVRHRIGHQMTLGTAIIIRHERDIVRSVNVGVPASSYSVMRVPDQGEDYSSPRDDRLLAIYDRLPSSFGQDRYVLTNPAGDIATYRSVEFDWSLRTRHWSSMAGAMAYRTFASGGNRGFHVQENDQGVLGELFENPNAMSYSVGELFFDRTYVLKWSTTYHPGRDILVAVIARYQDGQPFSRLVVAPDLAQGPEIVPAYFNGRTRFTFTVSADLRIEKGFRIGRRRASLGVDVFNLTNRANEVEEDPVTGQTFRQATAVQPPRTVRLGLRVVF